MISRACGALSRVNSGLLKDRIDVEFLHPRMEHMRFAIKTPGH
jgi:hypothetical protein